VDLLRIRSVLTEREFDVWLFYDHHHRDPIAYRILGLPEEPPASRRWFYVIPAAGNPPKTGTSRRAATLGLAARNQANVLRVA